MTDEIKMPERIARIICEMEAVCCGEGEGPENDELLSWIAEHYSNLKEEYSYLDWPK